MAAGGADTSHTTRAERGLDVLGVATHAAAETTARVLVRAPGLGTSSDIAAGTDSARRKAYR